MMKKTFTLLALMLTASVAAQAVPYDLDKYPWLDKSKSFHERAVLLVKELTLREKVDQLGNDVSEPIVRDGMTIVPAYQYWNEAIHGVARSGKATSFPESKGMSSTWNPQLVYDCATVISDEARIYHVNTGKGLNYWSPTINMARDPRWGRDEENYGEDPFLAGTLGVQFVKGFQGEITPETPYYKLVACAKHFAANNYEQGRQSTTSFVTEKNMREYYLPAFKMCVEQADVKSIMAAYNALSTDITEKDANNKGYDAAHGGLPCAGNKMLLTDILRNEWGFSGYVTSDCAGVACIHRATKHLYFGNYTAGEVDQDESFAHIHDPYTNSTDEEKMMEARSTSLAIKAGLDTNCEFKTRSSVMQRAGVNAATPAFQATETAAPNGQKYVNLTEDDIDQAVIRVLETRFALGEFDDYVYPVSNSLESEVNQALALKAAQQSIVLMKNEKANESDAAPLLPISTDKKVAIIGPYADRIMLGDYSGNPTYTTTTYQAVAKKLNYEVSDGTYNFLDYDTFSAKRGEEKFRDGDHVGNTAPGDWIVFNEIDFGSGCQDFMVNCATKYDPSKEDKNNGRGRANFYLDLDDADIATATEESAAISISNVDIAAGNWTTYKDIAVKIDPEVFKGKHKVTVKFTGTDGYVGNWKTFRFYTEGFNPLEDGNGPLYMVQTGTLEYDKGSIEKGITKSAVNEVIGDDVIARAVAIAKKADVVVYVGGTDFSKPSDHATGTEGHDRWLLTLPGNQEAVLKALYEVNKNVVLVLMSGSSLDINWEKENLPAIVEAWYGGQAQGQAVCDVLYGDYNPGGKLTSTWYNSIDELPQESDSQLKRKGMMEYNIDEWGYTYMYYGKGSKNTHQAEKPMYPFGYGLSYTTFTYTGCTIPSSFGMGEEQEVSVNVTNTGTRDGDEVIQVYAAFPGSAVGRPIKKLVGFKRVTVPAGQSVLVNIPVKHESFSYFDEATHTFRTESTAEVQIATSSADEDIKYRASVSTEAGTVGETYISTNIEKIPTYNERQLLKTDHIYSVMGAYVGPASCFDSLPKGVYVLNGVKYIKK